MKKIAMSLLLLTSCTGQNSIQTKGFSGHAYLDSIKAVNESPYLLCEAGDAYKDSVEAAENSDKHKEE